ncbi:serine hydroxymethyltransferase [Kibdelosporangium philippinense]|uniref:Probable serine hydroxymethyltransferase n=1 Tax=Kibdelosporangium philippinense TaxID=211113 RepID=A0ABS8Z4J4_9PSEU|nr:serine hydroxymethyltransferase [Kibdelosporangium philippinense]MCE7002402.1 serine hydroxymethyltransferase [Kibdelosporangium philippinense]
MTITTPFVDIMVEQYDQTLSQAWQHLSAHDRELARLLVEESTYQNTTVSLVASSSPAHPGTLLAEGTHFGAVTAEGYPGRRFHSGARNADALEELAITRATELFKAEHANVQPHSGSSANLAILFSVLNPGDRVLSMDLDAGGHLTHGSSASVTGRYFDVTHYGVTPDGWLDYDEIRRTAREIQPRMIICGASSYPRAIDFARFRAIADEVDAYLLADISHISGLVVSGHHASPIDHAHFTTTSTYKQLRGPRGGLILFGERAGERLRDSKGTVRGLIDRAVFPGFQGTPNFASIAAKAVALRQAATPEFAEWGARIRYLADVVAKELTGQGFPVVTGGTDTHMVMVDLRPHEHLTGKLAEDLLSDCDVLVNRNRIPGDPRPATVASGLRLGTNEIALRDVPADRVGELIGKICAVLASAVDPASNGHVRTALTEYVRYLCQAHPTI